MASTVKTRNGSSGLRKGSSVKIRPGVKDPDYGIDIGGWQGRVIDIQEGENDDIAITWDSITLKNTPDWVFTQAQTSGLDWQQCWLPASEVDPCEPRDDEKAVSDTAARISKRHEWDDEGKKGQRIQAVLSKAPVDDDLSEVMAWESHLRSVLHFPFLAKLSEDAWGYPLKFHPTTKGTPKAVFQRMISRLLQIARGTTIADSPPPPRVPDVFSVTQIIGSDERFGVMVEIEYEDRKAKFPLCDLKPKSKGSDQASALKDYGTWIANR